MAKPTIKSLTEELSSAREAITALELASEEDSKIIATLQEELAIALDAVKRANAIAAKKFDEVRPEPIRFKGGAILPSMSEMVTAINTLF